MFPPFPQEKAACVLEDVLRLVRSGSIKIEQVTRESEERRGRGFMLGALVCALPQGGTAALVASSGISRRLVPWGCDVFDRQGGELVFVPPIVCADEIELALSKNDVEIHRLTDEISSLKKENNPAFAKKINSMEKKRKELCAQSLENVHALYSFCCADGTVRTLFDVCREYNGGRLPPTGTGDCAAPMLLDYAFRLGYTPLSLAETPFSSVDCGPCVAGKTIPLCEPCDARCGIVLPAMLGIKIVYRDNDIIVVDKASNLLSVPGRGPLKQDCVVNRVKRLFPQCIEQPSVHRLDMETSGLMVLAFTKEAHRNLNRQFEEGRVKKEYVALLDGNLLKKKVAAQGVMELYFRLDVDNRPHQIWDSEHGKKAVTEWQVLGVERYTAPDGSERNVTRVLFLPHTGRTHQLRLASSDGHGFGVPIVGDMLYGSCAEGERLCLHAQKLSFTHPTTGKEMSFFLDSDF